MKKATLEEVKEYFKDAKTIESLLGDEFQNEYEFNYSSISDGIYVKNGSFQVWHPEKGYAKILTYKEKKFEITKEQILQLYNQPFQMNQINLESMFPEVFKKELIVGKWYKDVRNDSKALFYLEEIIPHKTNGMKSYGFSMIGEWTESCNRSNDVFEKFTEEATPQEVETALIKECEKLGLIDGVHYTSPNGRFKRIVKFPLRLFDGAIIDANNYILFDAGIFAKPIETITIQEAEKLLNKKIV